MGDSRRLLKWTVLMLAALVILAAGCRSSDARDGPIRSWLEQRHAAREAQPVAPQDSGDMSKESINVGGSSRSYFLHWPAGKKATGLPLVMVFHGGQGGGEKVARQTDFNRVADREGFAVVYPNSVKHWNDGRGTTSGGPDDISFVASLIDHLVETRGIDRRRVYATGASNGGMFTLRLACELTDRIAAFAPVVASFPKPYYPHCRPKRPASLMMINGTADKFIPWGGGTVRSGRRAGAGGEVIPVPETFAFWKKHNRCTGAPKVTREPDRDPQDGTTVSEEQIKGCAGGSTLSLVRVEGGGHNWPGTPLTPRSKRLIGNVSKDIHASELIWGFFRAHRL